MRRFFPPNAPQFLDGGLNNKFEISIIDESQSPDCLNVVYDAGSVGTRKGSTKLNTTAIGTFVIDGLYTRRTRTGVETMIAFAGGSAWTLAGTTFTTIGSSQSTWTSQVRVCAAQTENHIFCNNGNQIAMKYNGTDWTRHGVYPPTTTSTVASQATGGLTGAYQWKVTYVNSQSAEGDVGPITASFSVVAGLARVSNIPVAPQSYGIASRRLYRTANGGTTFKRVAEIADNTTTFYDDNIADASLGVTAPTDNGLPPKYNACIFLNGRLFVNDTDNPSYFKWSGVGEPYTFSATDFDVIGDDAGDTVKAFGKYEGNLVVFGEKSVTIVYMPTATSSDWKKVVAKIPYGCISPHCVVAYDNKLLFPAIEQNGKLAGFAALVGSGLKPDTTFYTVGSSISNLISEEIDDDIALMPAAYVPNMSGIAFGQKLWLAVSYGSSQTTNNRIYQLDFGLSRAQKKTSASWCPFTGINASQFTIYGGALYSGTSTATGFIYKLEQDIYSDDGAAINSYLWTKEFLGLPQEVNIHKDFRWLHILLDLAGSYNMTVKWKVDSDSGVGTGTGVSLDPGGATWNAFVWGDEVWGGGSTQHEARVPLGGLRGKRVQFYFSNNNTANQRFKIHWMKFTYNPKGER